MEVIILLVVAGLIVSVVFLFAFVWATRSGQYDDTETPPLRILTDDPSADPYTQVGKQLIVPTQHHDQGQATWM